MVGDGTELMRREIRSARRLARLFRAERSGRLTRRSGETARRLIARRGQLVAELARLEERRRSIEPWTPTELDLTMGALAREVREAEQSCLARLARLGAELARLRGAGAASGLRAGIGGKLLGRG